ncbi:MAG: inositol monophosphatase [Rhodobacteraceae bacterium PARR1]|nr:MAG: inositol monophosphatase [Rhodobacteraceae bacterium PARR1]
MTLSSDDTLLSALMGLMAKVAAAEVLPRFRAVMSESARTKTGPDDLVTDADIGAEQALGAALVRLLPGVVMVGEEAVSADPAVLDRLSGDDLVAVVDPVDGTWNFAHGLPIFGMILALVQDGKTLAGVIHYPVTGDFIAARPGGGAWHVAADGARTRLSVAAAAPVAELSGFIAPRRMAGAERYALRSLQFRATQTLRCSAWEYRAICSGAMGFTLTEGLMPWDHAAGVLIHAEAGGYAALLDGSPYHAGLTAGHLLLAPDAAAWGRVRDAFARGADV